jgi:hypothetical protein
MITSFIIHYSGDNDVNQFTNNQTLHLARAYGRYVNTRS